MSELILIDTTVHDAGNPLCACRYCRVRGSQIVMFDRPPLDRPLETAERFSERYTHFFLTKTIIHVYGSLVGYEWRYE